MRRPSQLRWNHGERRDRVQAHPQGGQAQAQRHRVRCGAAEGLEGRRALSRGQPGHHQPAVTGDPEVASRRPQLPRQPVVVAARQRTAAAPERARHASARDGNALINTR